MAGMDHKMKQHLTALLTVSKAGNEHVHHLKYSGQHNSDHNLATTCPFYTTSCMLFLSGSAVTVLIISSLASSSTPYAPRSFSASLSLDIH